LPILIAIIVFLFSCTDDTNIFKVKTENDGAVSIEFDSVEIMNTKPGIIVNGEKIFPDSTWQVIVNSDSTVVFEKEDQWRFSQVYKNAEENTDWCQIRT